jgi:sugar O-acyltransferase (sialic acid O-acetyltransferase NeuD family)
MKKVLVYGAGGLGREFCSYFSDVPKLLEIVGFAGNSADEHEKYNLPGHFFVGDITPSIVGTNQVVIAIGNPTVKERLYLKLKSCGFSFPSFVHPSTVISEKANLGEGVVISPGCVISPDVKFGTLSYLNFGCGVGHDTILGNFVQINPGTQLGGNVAVEDRVLIGSGVTVLQGKRIGEGATVGSGAVVFSNVSPKITVMGNPAKRMRLFEPMS